MTFKDCVNNDVRDVFLNTDAFGEVVSLCGGEVRAVVDDEGMVWKDDAEPALPQHAHMLYMATADVPAGCVIGTGVNFQGDIWTLEERKDEMGVTLLRLTRPVVPDVSAAMPFTGYAQG